MLGMVNAHGTPVTWDLVYQPVTDPLEFLPSSFYATPLVRTKLLVPHPFLSVGGRIRIGDHSFILNHDPGQQGHVWGRSHAREWIWFHCSSFLDERGEALRGYVTGVTAQQRLGLTLPPVSFGHLVWEELHFSIHPASPWRERREGPWEWRASTLQEEISVRLSVPWEEMVLAEYEDPVEGRRYCHHTDRADCAVEFRRPRHAPRRFESRGMSHLEIGSGAADPRAPRRLKIQT
jgi:hypothetical protein